MGRAPGAGGQPSNPELEQELVQLAFNLASHGVEAVVLFDTDTPYPWAVWSLDERGNLNDIIGAGFSKVLALRGANREMRRWNNPWDY